MKKVLILTVTAGNGHNACANAMRQVLLDKGAEVKVVDLLKSYSTKLNVWVADGGYSLAVSRLPHLYDYFYNKYKKADPEKRYSCPSQNTVASTLDGLLRDILDFKPDVIYCTHFYGSIALTDLKLMLDLPCKCIAANLDYVNSPFWEAGIGVDYFAIPNEDFINEFIAEGYQYERLLPLGLPVNARTLDTVDKAEARKQLGLDADVFTVLVMFGGGLWSGGFKIFKELLRALKDKNAQIIAINGKDKKGFKKIDRLLHSKKARGNAHGGALGGALGGVKILNVGFTDNVPLYLSAVDLAICKCGGTGATEIINKGVPMLVTEHVPAQEKHNIVYLKKKGVLLSFKNSKQLKKHIADLCENPDKLNEMTQNTLALKKPAILDLAEVILSQPTADYDEFTEQCKTLDISKKAVKKALKLAGK